VGILVSQKREGAIYAASPKYAIALGLGVCYCLRFNWQAYSQKQNQIKNAYNNGSKPTPQGEWHNGKF